MATRRGVTRSHAARCRQCGHRLTRFLPARRMSGRWWTREPALCAFHRADENASMAMLRVKRILRYSSSVIDVSLEIPIKKIARIWLWQLLLLGRRLPFLLLDRWMVGWLVFPHLGCCGWNSTSFMSKKSNDWTRRSDSGRTLRLGVGLLRRSIRSRSSTSKILFCRREIGLTRLVQ